MISILQKFHSSKKKISDMQVVIIEDEKIAADFLEKCILEFNPDYKVVKKLDSVETSVKWLSNHSADLLFVDIHLADDISFSIFEQMDIQTPVIFTTAYDQYAIKAFKLNSIDYLLKPIDKSELFNALNKFIQFRNSAPIDIKLLLEQFNAQKNEYQSRFLVSTGQKLKSLNIEQVAYFFSEQKLTFLVAKDGKHYVLDNSLDKLETILDPIIFFRINRQFIISFTSIKNMFSYSKSRVKVELEPVIEKETIVSVERSSEFRLWLNR